MDTKPLNIGIGFYAGSGKDTLCALIMEGNQHARRALGDSVKEELGCLLLNLDPRIDGNRTTAWRFVESKKGEFAMRKMMQAVGDGKRETVSKTYWIEQVLGYMGEVDPEFPPLIGFVVPDLRYQNEAKTFLDQGFLCVGIHRPDAEKLPGGLSGHISENDLWPWDFPFVIVNDGTPRDMLVLFRTIEDWYRANGNPPREEWPHQYGMINDMVAVERTWLYSRQ